MLRARLGKSGLARYSLFRRCWRHGRPANVAPFAHLFRSNVVFDADLSGVVVDASWLSRPMKGADADLRMRLEKAILDAEADCRMSFADRVECAIHQLVPTGPASAEEICHLLAINERTLRPEPTERPVLNV